MVFSDWISSEMQPCTNQMHDQEVQIEMYKVRDQNRRLQTLSQHDNYRPSASVQLRASYCATVASDTTLIDQLRQERHDTTQRL